MYFSNSVVSEFKAGFERKNQFVHEKHESHEIHWCANESIRLLTEDVQLMGIFLDVFVLFVDQLPFLGLYVQGQPCTPIQTRSVTLQSSWLYV
jgi:hypothetical protein